MKTSSEQLTELILSVVDKTPFLFTELYQNSVTSVILKESNPILDLINFITLSYMVAMNTQIQRDMDSFQHSALMEWFYHSCYILVHH